MLRRALDLPGTDGRQRFPLMPPEGLRDWPRDGDERVGSNRGPATNFIYSLQFKDLGQIRQAVGLK